MSDDITHSHVLLLLLAGVWLVEMILGLSWQAHNHTHTMKKFYVQHSRAHCSQTSNRVSFLCFMGSYYFFNTFLALLRR